MDRTALPFLRFRKVRSHTVKDQLDGRGLGDSRVILIYIKLYAVLYWLEKKIKFWDNQSQIMMWQARYYTKI